MSTHTAPSGLVFRPPGLLRPAQAGAKRAAAGATPTTPWLERLAAWAERQPRHRHLGSCRWL